MKNPYEEIFQTIKDLSQRCGYATFDYLPDESQGYPFVFIGEQVNSDQYTKDRVLGRTNILVHVYAEYNRRAEVAEILERLLRVISMYRRTPNFQYRVMASSTNIVGDKPDNIPLWHGTLSVDISYY